MFTNEMKHTLSYLTLACRTNTKAFFFSHFYFPKDICSIGLQLLVKFFLDLSDKAVLLKLSTDSFNILTFVMTLCARNHHSMELQTPLVGTDIYKCIFFPQIIRDWNSLTGSFIYASECAKMIQLLLVTY